MRLVCQFLLCQSPQQPKTVNRTFFPRLHQRIHLINRFGDVCLMKHRIHFLQHPNADTIPNPGEGHIPVPLVIGQHPSTPIQIAPVLSPFRLGKVPSVICPGQYHVGQFRPGLSGNHRYIPNFKSSGKAASDKHAPETVRVIIAIQAGVFQHITHSHHCTFHIHFIVSVGHPPSPPVS